MNNLIQAIAAYAEALEQKMSALEQRVSCLQLTVDSLQATNEQLQSTINTLQDDLAAVAAVGIVAQATEPEVEIELVIEEEPELLDEPAEEPIEGEPVAEPLEFIEPQEEAPQEELVEATIEESKAEVVLELVVEQPAPQIELQPAPKAEPAPRPFAQQTSLFGAVVEDIRHAISLGDRFLFQRELFAGNGELMQKTLDELNGLSSLEEAMDYVADNFEWDSASTAVKLFENVLKRRFA